MRRVVMASVALLAALSATVVADDRATEGPGWTGITNPEAVIAARQALMLEVERLMQPIDSFTVGERADPADLSSAAVTIAQILLAVPHLFPPPTNLYDPKVQTPATLALPAIWQDFPAFYALAGAAADAANAMGSMTEADALRGGALRLRAACDACHTLFLRPYVPEAVNEADQDFDFDKVFDGADEPKPR